VSRYQIWIEGDLVHSLRMIAQTRPRRENNMATTENDIAEDMIRAGLKQYPDVVEHRAAVNKMEKELLKKLGSKT
jgi:hypothetical protein